jgi:hypothetical protein
VRDEGFGPASLDRIAALVAERFGPGARYHASSSTESLGSRRASIRSCIPKAPNAVINPSLAEADAR